MPSAPIRQFFGRLAADTRVRFALRLFVSALLVVLALKVAGVGRVLDVIAQVRLLPLSAGLLSFLAATVMISLRWRIILDRMGMSLPFSVVLRLWFRGSLIGLVLPSTVGGDLARAAMLRRTGAGWDLISASIYLDRYYGLIAISLMAIPGLFLAFRKGLAPIWVAVSLGGVLIGPVLILTGALLMSRCLREIPPERMDIGGHLVRFVREVGMRVRQGVSRHGTALPAIALSLGAQTINIMSVSLLGQACNIRVPLGIYFIFTPLIWVASLVPVSISGVGLREIGFGILFRSAGLSFENGMVLGILMSAATIVVVATGGLIAVILPSGCQKDGHV